jgi:hypothetical protein
LLHPTSVGDRITHACVSSCQASRAKHLPPSGSQIDPLPCHTTEGGPGLINTVMCFSPGGSQIDPLPCHTTEGGPGLINTVMCFSPGGSQIDPLPCHTTEGGPGLINTVMCFSDSRPRTLGLGPVVFYACFLSSPRSTREGTPTRTPGTSFK